MCAVLIAACFVMEIKIYTISTPEGPIKPDDKVYKYCNYYLAHDYLQFLDSSSLAKYTLNIHVYFIVSLTFVCCYHYCYLGINTIQYATCTCR